MLKKEGLLVSPAGGGETIAFVLSVLTVNSHKLAVSMKSLADVVNASGDVYIAVSSANWDSLTLTRVRRDFAVRSPTSFQPILNLTSTPALPHWFLQWLIMVL